MFDDFPITITPLGLAVLALGVLAWILAKRFAPSAPSMNDVFAVRDEYEGDPWL